jgi:acyl-CoA reductase-like NAD-dependent aldehyde dehydrogenase
MKTILNWINNTLVSAADGSSIDKYNPHNGEIAVKVSASKESDVDAAVQAAENAFHVWSDLTPVNRGRQLMLLVDQMKQSKQELADCVALETGKPPKDALGEVNAAIMQGEYFAGEGMRLHGRTLPSGIYGKQSFLIREAIGVAGLIVPANTPIANIAWKVFPALICGNSVVMKASEDAPETAILFAKLCKKAGLADGVLNVIQGTGLHAGAAIVNHPKIKVISFTGSTEVGRWIAAAAGKRLARVSLELGGKNPFVVCDNANIEQAVHWASLSAFSNAGQRCAAGSRIIVFENIYDVFVSKLVAKAKQLQLGVHDTADLGPVITKRQQQNIAKTVDTAVARGARILCGGAIPSDEFLKGFYYQPTLIDNVQPTDEISCSELFGPVATLHKVKNLKEAIAQANDTHYGLTSAIHTTNIDQAMLFARNVRAGVCNINIGTFGSEPHMPFGGFGNSGNGSREPGLEALDVYSELKNISYLVRGSLV